MEIFQSVGQELLMMHRLISFVRELRIPGSASFSRCGEIPSAPVALLILILESICSVYSYYKLYLSCQVTGSHWLAHPKPQLCDYCEDIIVHIDT